MRRILSGHGASRGSVLGRARVRLPHALDVVEEHIEASEVDAEMGRLHAAIDVVRIEMHALRDRLHGALAYEVGEFLDLHALLLDDPELLAGLDALVRTGRYTADYALRLQRDRNVEPVADTSDWSAGESLSPRGAAALLHAAKAWAWLSGRTFVSPDEIKAVVKPTLRHRMIIRPELELEGVTADGLLDSILSTVPAPR